MKRTLKVSLVMALTVLLLASVASAWTADYYWEHTAGNLLTVTYKWGDRLGSPTYEWQQVFESGMAQWEAPGTLIDFSYSSSSSNVLNTYDADDGNYGICNQWIDSSTGKLVRFTAMGNVRTTSGVSTEFRQSVATHELGHGLGMGHSTETAIMNTSRDRDTIYVPQLDDMDGIKTMYP